MFRKTIIVASIAAGLSGCGAEDRAYDTVERSAKEVTVQSLDTESLWMYMPSTGEAPRYALTQRGFFQGDPKLVKLRFDETNGIYVEALDRDKVDSLEPSRWDSEINRVPVLKIPGEFRQYRCAENGYGECTNKEEINRDENVDWSTATHFIPDYENIESLSEDTLSTWYTASNVAESAEPRVISYEYNPEEGVINVEIERTYTANPDDQYKFGGLENLSFKTRFFYSLVKLDKLASPNYKPVYYQGQDSAYYGFFNDSKAVKTHTGESDVQGSRFAYINRFNPNLESIDYYLSDTYFDEGNEVYRQLTIDTMKEVNESLEGTGVPPIRIVNTKEKAGIKSGDLRYNVFNLIDEPVDNGLLGYGPSATNPLTGEIIHAHVNQYLGVIRTTTRRYWDDLAMRYNRQEIAKLAPKEDTATDSGDADSGTAPVVAERTDIDVFNDMITADRGPDQFVPQVTEDEMAFVGEGTFVNEVPKADLDHKFDVDNKELALQTFYKRQDMLKRFSEQNVYSEDAMWLSTNAKGLISGIDYADGGYFADAKQNTMKKWSELSLEQQKLASEAISEHMFKSTLIHELGHNLGLRHNFMGSVDKAHFYTADELAKSSLGHQAKPAAYSSIMDYGASIFDELLVFGKYDKAALKFAYAREIETNEFIGESVRDKTGAQVRKTYSLAEYDRKMSEDYNTYPTGVIAHLRANVGTDDIPELASYRFCTDEHTTTSLTCDRFDEGTSLTEITEFRIQRYYDSYETANRRNGRDFFSQYHQYEYFWQRMYEFQKIRDIVENVGEIDFVFARYIGANTTNNKGQVFEEIAENNCLDWRGNPKPLDSMSAGLRPICDTYNAANLAADFFLDVLTAPDKVCELEELSGIDGVPNRYRFAKLSDLWLTYQTGMSLNRDVPTSCFDEELVQILKKQANEIVMRSETRDGHIWSSLKANNPYQTASNSVDLLGVWPDKLLAAQMLVRRDSPYIATENSSLALIDLSDKITKLYTHLSDLAGRPEARQAIFVDGNGDYVETVLRYQPSLTQTIEAVPSYLWPMKRYFVMGGQEAFEYWTEGSPQDSVVPYFGTLLANLMKYNRANEYGLGDSVRGLSDSIAINLANSATADPNGINFTWKGMNYSLNSRNSLANAVASRALYQDEQKARVEKLNGLPYRVRNALSVFKNTRDRNEARIIAIGDKDALVALRDTTGFARFTMFDKMFEEYEEDGNKCLRFKVDGESDEDHMKRKCNSLTRLQTAQNSAIGKFEGDELEKMFDVAQIFGDQIAENNTSSLNASHKEVYDYDPEELRLWSSNEYVTYRRAFEQFPLYSD
ncbi:TPA: zinc-dependent metalloprotease [Vibrio harveyi]|nr:zinc-dependent metalloprotease [Vibrio harveyi]